MKKNNFIFFMYKFMRAVSFSLLLLGLSLGFQGPLPAYAGPFAGGDGTAQSPYEIETVEQLNSVRESVYMDKHFKLVSDIDLGSGFENWDPIGDSENRFLGTFDGGYHYINNITIERPEEDNIGLFGANAGEIKNVGVTGFVYGGDNTGLLVGSNTYDYVGGEERYGNINSCTSGGSVQGNNFVGGLVGFNDCGITQSYFFPSASGTAEITGNSYVGGLVGVTQLYMSDKSYIENSFALGNVSGSEKVGGLAGSVGKGENPGRVENCYTAGFPSGSSEVGGLAGAAVDENMVTNCYYNAEIPPEIDSGVGIYKTVDEMQLQSTFENWDFENTWYFWGGAGEGDLYSFPMLLNFQQFSGADLSGFEVGLAESSSKLAGEMFNLNISNARDVNSEMLSGDINVTVTSDRSDGEVCNTTAAFSGGEASLGITLNTTGVHTLTVDVDGITFGRDLTVEVREPAAPAASTLTPERGAAGVARDAAVSVEFDCDLTENDLSGIKIEYENGGSVQELGGVSGTLSNNTITIVHDEFAYSTEYTVTVPAGAVKSPDDLGNPEVTWSFMTEAAPDLSDFNVAVVDPGLPKYTGIPFDLDISNAVDAGGQNLTGDINVTVTSVPKYEENPVPQELYNGPVAFSGGEAAVSLTVTGMDPQAYIQTYTFTVNVEAITATRELDVAVHKQTAPEEEALMPADGATGLPANTEVSVVFDREIFAGSNIESIYIKKEGEESPREVSGTINGRKLTINHGGLEYQTEYTVTVPQDTVRNNVGKYNANFIRWNFTTGSAAKVEVYYSDTDPTRSNVEVWIHPKREGRQFTITNNNGSNDYVFTENGSFTFEFEDNLGNPGQYTVSVDWIIEEKPAFDHFEYIPCLNGNEEVPEPTNESIYVILYVKYEDGEVDSMGQAKVFSENGQYSFEAEHFSSNKVYSYPLTVDWIDKEAPEISVAKSVYTPTAEDVILTITPSEAVNLSVTNAGGQSLFQEDVSGSHDLAVQENCELTITAEDPAGNTSEKAVTIDNIFKDAPVLTYTGAQAIAAERGREEEALDSILSYMTAEDKQGNDISEDIEFAVKNSEINQFGDELLTYEFQVENEAGLGSNKIFVDMLVVERLSPAIFVDGEEVDNRITLEVPSGKASLTTAIDFAGFMGEYTVKLSGGEKPPAAFKKENVAYNSRVSGGKIEPFNLTPGTYTVYAYDQEMLDKSVVVEVVKGGEQQ